ncbi:methyl-accepting chemotaxis protein [Cellulosilyticum lentocellum]|uniref:Methyl-accepting chemotaxis sensory transducer n=1 Tax=Cellulosilyticum lentocellum (strain ATCC 49066 / DSM 5427 / NCIMB 11756 / RHM5) TaxID=642492 RepID=F2JSR3_CELLD|nr:methyl-accepting chemotaxis protein [Cellulosilyticum lentocellum]ADZ82897.1 methyl-accepting chemotaxis sensory transducer [Cellulosilyticum lentocellum DSM 5427]
MRRGQRLGTNSKKRQLTFQTRKKQSFKPTSTIRRNLSIKTRLIVFCLCISLMAVFILGGIYSNVAKSALRHNSIQLSTELVKQSVLNVENFVSSIEQAVDGIAVTQLSDSGLVENYFSTDLGTQVKAKNEIQAQLLRINALNSDLDEILFLSQNGNVTKRSDYFSTEEFSSFIEEDKVNTFSWITHMNLPGDKVLLTNNYKIPKKGANTYTLAVVVNLANIKAAIQEMKMIDGATIYLADQNQKILFCSKEEQTIIPEDITQIASGITEAMSEPINGRLVTCAPINNGWQFIVEVPMNSLTSELESANILLALLIIGIIILTFIIGNIFARSFSKPILKLVNLMQKAEKGDFTVQVSGYKKDEVGQLCHSFNEMMRQTGELLKQTQHVVTDTLESGHSLQNTIFETVNNIEQLTTGISDLAEGTMKQAQDTQKTNGSMNELAQHIYMVKQKTSDIIASTVGATTMIEKASNTMKALNTTMSDSLNVAEEIGLSMNALNILNKNINHIMQMVENISEETNLLALNASIEAARAGEAGKGFSVVAKEVRRLADQSKQSVGEVRQTLATMENHMSETLSLVEESRVTFNTQEKVVKETYEVFYSIIDILQHMSNELLQVGTQVDSMEGTKVNVMQQVGRIRDVTQEAAATTQEVNSLSIHQQESMNQLTVFSEALIERMEKLNHTIQAFKVTEK